MQILYCIIHFGDPEVTKNCLKSLKFKDYKNVLIVDVNPALSLRVASNATWQSRDFNFIQQFKNISIIRLNKNFGYGHACNIGIKFMKKNNYDYIFLCNNDVTFSKDFNKKLHTYLYKNKVDIAGFIIKDAKNSIWFDGGEIDPIRWSGGHVKDKTDYVSGCAMLISKNVINQVGLFDSSYFMYYEDVDYCYHVKLNKFDISILPFQINHHTSKTKERENIMEYYLARNRIRFMKKFAPKNIILRELIRSPKTIWEYIINRNYSGLKGFFNGIFLNKN